MTVQASSCTAAGTNLTAGPASSAHAGLPGLFYEATEAMQGEKSRLRDFGLLIHRRLLQRITAVHGGQSAAAPFAHRAACAGNHFASCVNCTKPGQPVLKARVAGRSLAGLRSC